LKQIVENVIQRSARASSEQYNEFLAVLVFSIVSTGSPTVENARLLLYLAPVHKQ